jgi:hypothetical protein
MTPKQLAELEIWLAAGFDLPTAMAAVQGSDEEDGEADDDEPQVPPSQREQPSIWHYLLCLILALAVVWLVLR